MEQYQFSRPLSRSEGDSSEMENFLWIHILGYSFESISQKVDGMVDTMGNWDCMVLGLNRPEEEERARVHANVQMSEFSNSESLINDSAETRQINDLQ